MTEPTALRDDQPTPWYPCPECGEVWLRITAVLERGNWVDTVDGEAEVYVIEDHDSPHPSSYISKTPEGEPAAIECTTCGHRFNMPSSGLPGEEAQS